MSAMRMLAALLLSAGLAVAGVHDAAVCGGCGANAPAKPAVKGIGDGAPCASEGVDADPCGAHDRRDPSPVVAGSCSDCREPTAVCGGLRVLVPGGPKAGAPTQVGDSAPCVTGLTHEWDAAGSGSLLRPAATPPHTESVLCLAAVLRR